MNNKTSTEINWKEESKRFDGVADIYNTYRPDYPEELIESLISMTGIKKDSHILEIGSGTGKATLMFAQRGFSILCIEPGKNLVSVAAQNLKNYSQITFETVAFEEWDERQSEFDLVFSAQAFHWVPKEVGYAKVSKTLKQKGYLALFWNMYPDPKGKIFVELDKVYRQRAPGLANRPTSYEIMIQERERNICDSGLFDNVSTIRFPWSARYDTKQYLGLLSTYSDHLRLSKKKRENLYEGVAEIIDKYGGYIEKPYIAVLYVARNAA